MLSCVIKQVLVVLDAQKECLYVYESVGPTSRVVAALERHRVTTVLVGDESISIPTTYEVVVMGMERGKVRMERLASDAATRLEYSRMSENAASAIAALLSVGKVTRPYRLETGGIVESERMELSEETKAAIDFEALIDCFKPQTRSGRTRLREWFENPLVKEEEIAQRQEAIALLRASPYLDWEARMRRLGSWTRPAASRMERTELTVPMIEEWIRSFERTVVWVKGASSLLKHCRGASLPCLKDALQCVRRAHVGVRGMEAMIPEGFNGEEDVLERLVECSEATDTTMKDLRREATELRERTKDAVSAEAKRIGLQCEDWKWDRTSAQFEIHSRRTATTLTRTQEFSDVLILGTTKHQVRWTSSVFHELVSEWSASQHAIHLHVQGRLGALLGRLGTCWSYLYGLASSLSTFDALLALTSASERLELVRPQPIQIPSVCQQNQNPLLVRGMHNLLVESCVRNDVVLDGPGVVVLTGSNMAGKSTLAKTMASLLVLHQVGSYLPATYARLPILDTVGYQRGTADAQSIGLSSFTKQLVCTTSMLHASHSKRAFLFFDELGAATAVDEGEALATAILEYAASQGHWCLATTHYDRMARGFATRLRIQAGFRVSCGVDTSDGIETAKTIGFCPDVISFLDSHQ